MGAKIIPVIDKEGIEFYGIEINVEEFSKMYLEHFFWQTIYKVISYDKFKKIINKNGGVYKQVVYVYRDRGKYDKIKFVYVFKMRIDAEMFLDTVNSWVTMYKLMKED